ncbi:hypothetical protein [Sphingomonas sp. CLY1604]|uniref:hypothetical protein n=1 Tax=Sphingomonas sp. CLY1604 TaxID=3457786 RepID=UPI003FD7DC05
MPASFPALRLKSPPALPSTSVAALALMAAFAAVLPGGGWSDATALLALVAALVAAHDRRYRAMLVAAGLAAGLSSAGLLLAPLLVGWPIARGAARHLPIAALTAAAAWLASPWHAPSAGLPNLAAIPLPHSVALVAALGAGSAAWLAARAAASAPADLMREARLGTLVLAAVLPLPAGAFGFVAALALLPLAALPARIAANDNLPMRRVTIRLAA